MIHEVDDLILLIKSISLDGNRFIDNKLLRLRRNPVAIKNAGTELHGGGESLARGAGSLVADSAPRLSLSCQTRTFSPGALALPSDALELSSPCSKPPLHKCPHSMLFFVEKPWQPKVVRFVSYFFFFLSIFLSFFLSKAHECNALSYARVSVFLELFFSGNFCCSKV